MFCIYLRTNSDLCHLQHKLIGFYNRDKKCLQRGTDWVFKQSGLRFVFKGLIFNLSFTRFFSSFFPPNFALFYSRGKEQATSLWGPSSVFLMQWVSCYFSGSKRTWRDVDHSPPSSTEVSNEWRYTSSSLILLYDE